MLRAVYPGSFDPLTIAHLGIAEAVVEQFEVERVDLAISRRTLGKGHLRDDSIQRRAELIERVAATRAWLGLIVVDTSLVVDIARGYDLVVMGADKWAQVNDPHWYGGDPARRDAALAALPRAAVAPRPGHDVPAHLLLRVPRDLGEISSSAVRAGRTEWAATDEPRRRPRPD